MNETFHPGDLANGPPRAGDVVISFRNFNLDFTHLDLIDLYANRYKVLALRRLLVGGQPKRDAELQQPPATIYPGMENVMVETTEKKITREHEFTTEISSLRQLVSEVGSAKADRLLGMKNAAGPMVNEGRARPVYEIAAKYILQEMHRKDAEDIMFLVRIPADKFDAVNTVLKALGVEGKAI